MKRLLLIIYVVVEVLSVGLMLVSIWRTFGIGNTSQGLWVALGAFLVAMVVELSFRWLRARGYQFSDSDMQHNGTRPWGPSVWACISVVSQEARQKYRSLGLVNFPTAITRR